MRLLLLMLVLVSCHVFGQDLYKPRNIETAYRKGTRSPDGKPGRNYWQNRGSYDIEITAMPPDRRIDGIENITYFNDSPDTLRNIVLRLLLNIHKPGVVRDLAVSQDYLTGGVIIDSFTVNGKLKLWDGRESSTVQGIRLFDPLLPKDSLQLFIKWHYEISREANREGMTDSTSWFFAYFYPRISVYDDYYGWDVVDFTDQKEFYNDFNDYKLTVHVPKNYLVWATGDLLNAEEVLQPGFAARYRQSLQSNEVIRIATAEDVRLKKVTLQNDLNSWKFSAKNIPDVAAAMSDHYVWDAGSTVVDSKSGRRASVQAAYYDSSKDYHYVVDWAQKDLAWLSRNWPGWPYPYSKTTIVQGHADMEYPMMVNDNSFEDTSFSRFVAAHEMAHTWFPFYMGINESRYAFMDEGWATTFELLINRVNMDSGKAEQLYKRFRIQNWMQNPTAEQALPIMTPASVIKNFTYGDNAYGKPSLAYLALKDMLGDELFKKCLHEYIRRWNGKHPTPWDFFYTFNDVSKRNLDWFWNSWFFSPNYIDIAVDGVKKSSAGYDIDVSNIGGFQVPFDLLITYADGSKERKHKTSEIWQKNPNRARVTVKTKKAVTVAELSLGIFLDSDVSNNKWRKNY